MVTNFNNFSTGNNAALILSTGSAFGNHYTTEQIINALDKQQKLQGNDNFDLDFAIRVLHGCGFKHHSIVLPLEDVFRRFSRSEYLEHRSKYLVRLAERAGIEALNRWGGERSRITHLFWGTMTGAMHSPTIDIELVIRLGLDLDVERTSIEGMGCLTGFRLLNLARQVVSSDPNARVLVIEADLRSALGNSMPKNPTRADIVSVCLFRDAASSAVVGSSINLHSHEDDPCYEIVTGASRIVDQTRNLVNYFETDDGSVCLHLEKQLPMFIGQAEPKFVQDLLEKGQSTSKHNIPSVESFDILCHTGGPKVLKEVAKSLGVTKGQMRSSWEVMTSHGNLSGASNLAVLDHHNQLAENMANDTSEWALCLSMGPGVCLEGLIIRDVRRKRMNNVPKLMDEDSLTVVHIVGCGIAGATLAAGLDPKKYKVRIFEASQEIREQGYGLAVWPSTLKILRDELGIQGIDIRKSSSMIVRSIDHKMETEPRVKDHDKGFMKRNTLLKKILLKVEERHPGCIYAGHKALGVRFKNNLAWTTYETKAPQSAIISHSCDLLVGADGVNSIVRRYVALKSDSRQYGHMTAYRFLIHSPSEELLKESQGKWNMCVSESIHSPSYHISNFDESLNVVVLEYDGKPPSYPRRATFLELQEVARRSNLNFILMLLETEDITDIMCYSTFHIDCEPWCQSNAVLIGDAAHAYGPLTAKMANLAINDAHSLAVLLNHRAKLNLSQEQILNEWEKIQRPKFEVTKIRTLRHLQLYRPSMRAIMSFLWKYFPNFTLRYFQSIFAYDYEVQSCILKGTSSLGIMGIMGITIADPLFAYAKRCINDVVYFIGIGIFAIILLQQFLATLKEN